MKSFVITTFDGEYTNHADIHCIKLERIKNTEKVIKADQVTIEFSSSIITIEKFNNRTKQWELYEPKEVLK